MALACARVHAPSSCCVDELSSSASPSQLRTRDPSPTVEASAKSISCFASAARLTDAWGMPRITLRGLGHINADSGLGSWDAGRALLGAFEAQVGGAEDPSQRSLAVLPVSTFDDQAAELI